MIETDVTIVGGGPAGCATALALMQKGLQVSIICAPGTKIKPTETSVPVLANILRSLHAEEALQACEPCYGISSTWGRSAPTLRPSMVDPHGHAWFVHRRRFDEHLRQTTRNAGAVWIENRVQEIHFEDSHILISTDTAIIRTQWLVAATGCPTWPARFTKQEVQHRDSLIALWTYLPFTLKERLLFVEPTDFGWWYICPDDGSGAIACLVTDQESARELRAAQSHSWNNLFHETAFCQQFCAELFGKQVHAALTGLSFLPQCRGNRWTVVGDAAAKLDPIGSSGIVTALDGGRRAGMAVGDALRGNMTGVERYEQWIRRLVGEFERQRTQHYLIERAKRSGSFWQRRTGNYSVETNIKLVTT